jgi:ABC-type transport system involved in cytochrome c biogenesis permease component
MTLDVIDLPRGRWLPGFMSESNACCPVRYDRTLRAVMWMDAFLSAAVVVVAVIASAVVAAFGVPGGMTFALGLAVIVCAALLATFGAITGVLLMARLRAGEYLLPAQLRLPLPAPMRPELALVRSAGTGADPGLWSVVDRVADERARHAVTAAAAAAEFCADDRDDLDARLA